MKKLIFLFHLFCCLSTILFAQNFLSPEWKISLIDTSAGLQNKWDVYGWKALRVRVLPFILLFP